MPPFQPGIREYFGADDCPDRSSKYLHARDPTSIRRIALAGDEASGIVSHLELQDLRRDDRRGRTRRLEDRCKAWPYVRTEQVKKVEHHRVTLPEQGQRFDDELRDFQPTGEGITRERRSLPFDRATGPPGPFGVTRTRQSRRSPNGSSCSRYRKAMSGWPDTNQMIRFSTPSLKSTVGYRRSVR